MTIKDSSSVTIYSGRETIRIEAWGKGIRVRAVPMGEIPQIERALMPYDTENISVGDDHIENAGLRCEITNGHLRFVRVSDEKVLLEENTYPWALHRTAREYKTIPGLGSQIVNGVKHILGIQPVHGLLGVNDSHGGENPPSESQPIIQTNPGNVKKLARQEKC